MRHCLWLGALVVMAWAGMAGKSFSEDRQLLANGGFEEVIPVSDQDWKPYLMDGWILAGKPQLPASWKLCKLVPESYVFPGSVEVVEAEGVPKEGKRCLRLSTPATYWAHTSISASFKAPPSRTVAWSFWAKGSGGEYVNSLGKFTGTPGRRLQIQLSYAGGSVIIPSQEWGGRFIPETWTNFSGVTFLKDCVGGEVAVTIVVFQAEANVPSSILLDDIVFSEAPAPEIKAPAVVEPIVSRTDYELGKHWPLPPIFGKSFWFIQKDYLTYPLPRWRSLVERSAQEVQDNISFTPRDWGKEPTPFFVHGLRFGAGEFFDDWKRKYGRERKPFVMKPRFAYDGIKDNCFAGWQSKPGLPQTIDLKLGKTGSVESVRIYPSWEEGRKSECAVYLSADGKDWKKAGVTSPGINSPQGYVISCASQEVGWVRVEVTKDSAGHVFLVEVEAVGKDGAVLPVKEAQVSSTVDIVAPEGMKTLRQRIEDTDAKYGGRFIGLDLGEWDNDLFANGDPLPPWCKQWPQEARSFGLNPVLPKTREEAMTMIQTMFKLVKETYGNGRFIALNSLSIWDHYGMEFGSVAAYAEITGQYDERVRLRMASSRGAARQYGKPWMAYLVNACWVGRGVGMTSSSMFFRELMLSYMLGCNLYNQESSFLYFRNGAPFIFLDPLLRADEFISRHPDRGIPYTPVVLGLDWLHGHDRYGSAFYSLPAGHSDRMIGIVAELLMPSRPTETTPQERELGMQTDNWNLSNSSFGDVFDIMVLNPPSDSAALEKLNAYKVMVLLGEIRWTKKLADRLREYVEAGGTLFCSADQIQESQDMAWCGISLAGRKHESRSTLNPQGEKLEELPEKSLQVVYELAKTDGLTAFYKDETGQPLIVMRKIGKGSVVVCTVDSMIDKAAGRVAPAAKATLQRLHDESLPVRIEGDIEFAVSRNETSWIITLVNNRGIRKDPMELKTVIDYDKYATVRIKPRVPISAAKEWLAEDISRVVMDKDLVKEVIVTVPPGDVRVVELVTGKTLDSK